MFTGIVQKTAVVKSTKTIGTSLQAEIALPPGWKFAKGASVAVDGVCVTVTGSRHGAFSFECMPVTLKKTTAGKWEKGRVVNLERALKQKDLLDGHLIQGHVEGRARIASIKAEGRSKSLTLVLPRALAKTVALHGSVAVNGVSLTVSRMQGDRITVSLIPYTLSRTNLDELRTGDEVNIETDFLARHLSRKSARVKPNATRRAR